MRGAALLPGGGPELLFTVQLLSHKGRILAAPNQQQAAKALGKIFPAEPKPPPSPCLTISCCSSLLGKVGVCVGKQPREVLGAVGLVLLL